MKLRLTYLATIVPLLCLLPCSAATLYVDVEGTNPTPPYSSWSTASTDIQSAIDAANPGDLVLVTNGVYQTGGRTMEGFSVTNRVALTKAVTVQSVNGPAVTLIAGYQIPGVINGGAAVRCAQLAPGAMLIGFTLTNGATITNGDPLSEMSGGGAKCDDNTCVLSNCVFIGNNAGYSGGAALGGTLYNCRLASNSAAFGGGTFMSDINDSVIVGNYAQTGGGGVASEPNWAVDFHNIYNRCTLVGNVCSNLAYPPGGGGSYGGILNNCTLSNNLSADLTEDAPSGGADEAWLNYCWLSGNTADYGGGTQGSYVYDCLIVGNHATQLGGGVRGCYDENCSIAMNSADGGSGGADASELDNCIIYFNTGSSNANCSLDNCTINYSCTTPLPGSGPGNLDSDPLFVDLPDGNLHLQSSSPCINAGSSSYVSRTNDFEGKPRIIGLVVDMGAYEFPTPVAISASYTNVAIGFVVKFISQVYVGSNSSFTIDFGDGVQVTNQLSPAHSWTAPGDYTVTLTAFSDSCLGGVSTSLVVHVIEGIYYVSLDSTNPIAPYDSWDTAATNIQDAVDVAVTGGTILASNGVYNVGGQVIYGALTNRVTVTKPVIVRGLNGPAVTTIQGYQTPGTTNDDSSIRCIYLTNSASLIGFTLSGGATRSAGDSGTEQSGGAIWCEDSTAFISNCVISGNAANNVGGGAYRGTYINCSFTGNFAIGNGGGVSAALLNQCTFSGNFSVTDGGGADSCTATNCAFAGNSAYHPPPAWEGGGGGGANGCTLNQCTFTGNSGYGGGAVRSSTMFHCLIESNSVSGLNCGGGGIENSIASDCTIINNYSDDVGGGVDYSALTNCLIAGNQAGGDGGGYWGEGAAYFSLNNCLVISNSAGVGDATGDDASVSGEGGGVNYASLYNCTVVGNSAAQGGGVFSCSVYNSIVVDNDAGYQANHVYTYFENTCTTPLPIPNENGRGNFSADPQLTDAYHLSAGSPCRGAGNPVYALSVDFDGLSWGSPPSIGCDEYHATAVTGPLTDSIQANFTTVASGFTVNLTAQVVGRPGSSVWDFGDGTAVTNQPFISHTWSAPGDYAVRLTTYNGSNPGGVSATTPIHVMAPPVHYVSLNSANPVAPFTSWDTAAANIQDAVDASTVPGALILVSNGVYNTGGQIVFGILSNRVAVTKPVTVRSVNGAAVTVILGNPVTGGSAVRCLWMTNGSALRGFTITQGATRDWSGDEPREISAGGVWCQSLGVVVSDCTFLSNSASWDGGGIAGGTISNCTFIGNSGGDSGGGGAGGIYSNCSFQNNIAVGAGGVWDGTVNNSYFIGNVANVPYGGFGGGTYEGVLNNCALSGNVGDAAATSLLNNCTLVDNVRGGAESCTLNNCIAFYNADGNGVVYNYSPNSVLNYCCAAPLAATNGVNNFAFDPKLTDLFHLSADSPCRGAGNPIYATGVDLDGQAWFNPPSIGCNEYYPGATGPLTVAVEAAFTNIAVGFGDGFNGQISGHASANRWDFGDGTVVSNQLSATHGWALPGDYSVILTAYNDDNPGGVSATAMVQVVEGIYYVAQGNLDPVAPYASWDSAATNIQDAAEIAVAGGTIFVSNGVYQAGTGVGGGMTNRVAATVPLVIQSMNGEAVTVIDGMAAVQCVYLTNGAALSGFTITNGNGGGIAGAGALPAVSNCVIIANAGIGASQCQVSFSTISKNTASGASGCELNHCLITGNTASGTYAGAGGAGGCTLNYCLISNNASIGSYAAGGGAGGCTLNNCLVVSNSASYNSGGVNASTLNNCTVVGNTAGTWGGGEGNSTVNNSIVYYNTCPGTPDIGYSSTVNYTCASSVPLGPGNFTNPPAFVNLAAGDFHFQTNSPCINAGNNGYAVGTTDLDGNPRIVRGTVDLGAYEFQTPPSLISYAWLEQYGLPTDGSADFADTDGTGMNNWQKWIAGLNPIDPTSVFVMLPPGLTNSTGVTVSWKSVNTRTYYLQRASDLAAQSAFTTIQSNLVGQAGVTSYTDTSVTNGGPYFYRVGVQ